MNFQLRQIKVRWSESACSSCNGRWQFYCC